MRKSITKIGILCILATCMFSTVSASANLMIPPKQPLVKNDTKFNYKEWNNKWIFEDKKWRYIINEQRATGIQNVDGLFYYFDSEGNMPVGWSKVGNEWVYSFFEKSPLATGWQELNGIWYYFNSNGIMAHDTYVGNYYLGSDGAWVK